MKYQITIICTSGKYKPCSTLIESGQINLLTDKAKKKALITRGVQKICAQHYWGKSDLKKYDYNKVKIREYDIAKIKKENKERYERIKEEKYASGEWKRPENKC